MSTGAPWTTAIIQRWWGALDDLIVRLQLAGKRVVLIGPIAKRGWDVASVLSRQLSFGRLINRPDRVQCSAEHCDYLLDGRSLFADNGHIAMAELPRFRAVFEAALPPAAVGQR